MNNNCEPFIIDCIKSADFSQVYTKIGQIEALTPAAGRLGLVMNDSEYMFVQCLFADSNY